MHSNPDDPEDNEAVDPDAVLTFCVGICVFLLGIGVLIAMASQMSDQACIGFALTTLGFASAWGVRKNMIQ